MPKCAPVTCCDGAVFVRQNPAYLAHAGSFLGLALDQSDSMSPLAGVVIDSVNRLIDEQRSLKGSSRFSLLLSIAISKTFETLCCCLNFRSWMNHSIDHGAARPSTTPSPV